MNAPRPRPFKPASPAVIDGVAKLRAMRRAFLRDQRAILRSDGEFMERMEALDRNEAAYQSEKRALFAPMSSAMRRAIWERQ